LDLQLWQVAINSLTMVKHAIMESKE